MLHRSRLAAALLLVASFVVVPFALAGPVDGCDVRSCAIVQIDTTSNVNNVLDTTTPAPAQADPLYWGRARVWTSDDFLKTDFALAGHTHDASAIVSGI